jgi:transposase
MGRGDLTNQQWARLEPLLPTGKKPGRPPTWSKRQLINGIRWRTRTGAPWRDVPARYGPWQTVYGLFRRWQRDGTRQQILTGLQAQADARGLITWQVSVDSTIARAHQHAAGARKGGPATRRTGRSRHRAHRSWARALPGRADEQAAPGRGGWPAAAVARGHRWPAR